MPGVCARHSSHQSPVLPRLNTPLSHHCGDTGRWPGQGSLIWDMTEASFVSPPGPGLGWAGLGWAGLGWLGYCHSNLYLDTSLLPPPQQQDCALYPCPQSP